MKTIDCLCVWDCCWVWLKVQSWVAFVVFDPFVELFITLCIVVNTLFMALDHHDMDKDMEKILKSGNYVSSALLLTFTYSCTRINFNCIGSVTICSFLRQRSPSKPPSNYVPWVRNFIFKWDGTSSISLLWHCHWSNWVWRAFKVYPYYDRFVW